MRIVIAIDDASVITTTEEQQNDIMAAFLEQCGDIFEFKTHDPQRLDTIPRADIYVIDFGGLGIGLNTGRAERCANLLLKKVEQQPGTLFCIWSTYTMSWYRGAMADHLGNENEEQPLPDNVEFYDALELSEFWNAVRAWCGLSEKPEPDKELEERIWNLRFPESPHHDRVTDMAAAIDMSPEELAQQLAENDPDEWLDRYQAKQRRKYFAEQEDDDADADADAESEAPDEDEPEEEEEEPAPELTEEERAAKKAALIAKLSAPISVDTEKFDESHRRPDRPEDGGPGWGDIVGEIRIPVRIGTRPNLGAGFAYFKFADCIASVSDDDGDEIGTIGGAMGGVYEISFPTGTGDLFQYMLRPEDIWPVIVELHNEFRERHKDLFKDPEPEPENAA